MRCYIWALHCPLMCLGLIQFYCIELFSLFFFFCQGLPDSDVRGKVRFSFKSKGLDQQNWRIQFIACSQEKWSTAVRFFLGEWLHSYCRMLLGFERAKVKEWDLLLLPGKADIDRQKRHHLSTEDGHWNVKDRVGLGWRLARKCTISKGIMKCKVGC